MSFANWLQEAGLNKTTIQSLQNAGYNSMLVDSAFINLMFLLSYKSFINLMFKYTQKHPQRK